MNNEPVAWIDKSKLDDWLHGDCYPDQCFIHYQANDAIPLYTHPVKELTLTEDEIDDVWAACSTGESDTIDMHLFAEAILKKAQEK